MSDEVDDDAEMLIGYIREEFVDELENDWRESNAMGSWSEMGWHSGDTLTLTSISESEE